VAKIAKRKPLYAAVKAPLGESNDCGISREKVHSGEGRAAKSAAFLAPEAHLDADLEAVIEAWPNLPESDKADILAMVKSAGDK
jgi:hypothetical protein